VITGQIINIFAAMLAHCSILPHNFFPFFVGRRALVSREIAHVQRDIPFRRRPALITASFRLSNRVGKTFALMLHIGSDVRVPHRPQSKRALLRRHFSGHRRQE
jgi:hypothetical protein